MLSDQHGQCELYGVVDLFLRGADQDQVQGSGDLGLEGFGGGEVAEESGEDVENVSGGHEESEISGHVDCNFHRNAIGKHLEQRINDSTRDISRHGLDLINSIPLQIKLLELGWHLNSQLLNILLQQLIRLLTPNQIQVKIDDKRELKIEHLQDNIDELGTFSEDLADVFLGGVVF